MINNKTCFPRLSLLGLVGDYLDYYFPVYLCLDWLKIMMIIMFQPPLWVELDEEDSIWRVKAEAHNKVFLINSDQ